MRRIKSFLIKSLLVLSAIFSTEGYSNEGSLNYAMNGYGAWQFGEIMRSTNPNARFSHVWLNSAILGLNFESWPSENLKIVLRPEFKLFYPFPERLVDPKTRRSFLTANFNDMNGTLVFGGRENPFVEMRLGIFSYKYNPDVNDLGEYMFRTGSYPPLIMTDFDFPKARLCGIHLRGRPIQGLTIDGLFTSELQLPPLYDFSLSFIANYNLLNIVQFGAGIDWCRLFPIADSLTSPDSTNKAIDLNLVRYIKPNGDTAYYSYKSTKYMGRLSFDPKGFFPGQLVFPKADFKLYGEIALLGQPIKSKPDADHPDFYGDYKRLMPMMLGFNVPVYKSIELLVNEGLLNKSLWKLAGIDMISLPLVDREDIFSFELEYFPSRMPNDLQSAFKDYPVPFFIGGFSAYFPENYRQREFAWAFYTKKKVIKGFDIIAQAAYDHFRVADIDGTPAMMANMTKKGDWYWLVKTQFSF